MSYTDDKLADLQEDMAHMLREIAGLADELAFWKHQAIWWRAYADNGIREEPDDRDMKRAEGILEDARRQENVERVAHAEAPRTPGGT